jgi:hypothetical protein
MNTPGTSDAISVYETAKGAALASPNGSPRNSASFENGALESVFGTLPLARSVDVDALTARNRQLTSVADRVRVRAAEQVFCLQQAIHVRALGAVMSLGEFAVDARQTTLARIANCGNKLAAAELVVGNVAALIDELETFCCRQRAAATAVRAPDADHELRLLESETRASAVSGIVQTLRNIQAMCVEMQKMQAERDAELRRIYDAMLATFGEHFDATHFGIVIDRCALRCQACNICGEQYDCTVPRRQQVLLACCQLKQSLCVECLCRHAYTNSNFASKLFFHCAFCRTELRLYGQFETAVDGAR